MAAGRVGREAHALPAAAAVGRGARGAVAAQGRTFRQAGCGYTRGRSRSEFLAGQQGLWHRKQSTEEAIVGRITSDPVPVAISRHSHHR